MPDARTEEDVADGVAARRRIARPLEADAAGVGVMNVGVLNMPLVGAREMDALAVGNTVRIGKLSRALPVAAVDPHAVRAGGNQKRAAL